jgi:HK97 family phage major capsid protein
MPFEITIERDTDIEALDRVKVRKALQERSEVLHKVFEEAGDAMDHSAVKSQEFKTGQDMATFIRKMNEELSKIGQRETHFTEMEKGKEAASKWQEHLNGHDGPDPAKWAPSGQKKETPKFKSFGQAFVESDAYKAALEKRQHTVELKDVDAKAFLEQKAEFTTAAGWAPETLRTGRVVLDEQREIEVTDALPVFPTTQAAIVYMEETTFTNAAAERAESAAYAESALALTERSSTVRSVGTSLPVTDEQLADVEGVRAYLDQRLGFMVRQRLDSQILVGNGTPPNLTGTLNVASINTQAKGTDPVPDAIYKGMDLVRVTGRAMPNVVIVHPTDWQAVRLLKTADGIYIWGSPSEAGPARIWGLPVILTTAVTENTAIVGDYARFSGLHVRQGLEVLTGFVNDDFLDGRVTIRAGLRVAVVHYRPTAFTKVTGL